MTTKQIADLRSYIRDLTNAGKHLEASYLASLLP
jgi:hypothetical protein